MWIWDQSAGTMSRGGALISRGYSGRGRGKNNPSMQAAVGVGPIPRGHWSITERYDSSNVGRFALKLEPVSGTNTFGRSAFRIHGDSIANPGTASHGCIILPRDIRTKIWASADHSLEVIE
jgi:Protein of unknown function (DUF2778)